METLALYILKRFAPRVGWPLALLLLGVACTPALAASDGALDLPAGLLTWAGLLGALLGLRAGRARGWPGGLLWAVAAVALALLCVVAEGRALPPAGLLWQDLVAGGAAVARWWRGAPLELPGPLAWRYLQLSLPRLGADLAAAPEAGEAGARLIVATLSLVGTVAGASMLGLALAAGRSLLVWGVPLLVALGLTTILSGSGGSGLVIGMLLLLFLVVAADQRERERAWERSGTAYAEDLGWSALGWGAFAVMVAVLAALALPTELPTPLARLIWPELELPSGIAAIERNVQRGSARPAVDPGLSQLPVVNLGESLERGPPETVSLRIGLAAPLEPAPWPRYWRARVLNRYNGRRWSADARVASFGAPLSPGAAPPGAIVQQVEDLRQGAILLAALPDVIGVDGEVLAERLPDGSLAALTGPPGPRRYTAISLPQGRPPPVAQPPAGPAYLDDSLALPANLPPRVSDLARTVAGGAATPLDQALALEAYLRGLPYSYQVRPLPRGGDAVDQFLFEMREGYCTYYASAMVIMARSLGIPARMAIGYASGAYDTASRSYLVREADAHAWPELFIAGRWLPFEPTPVRSLPARSGAVEEPLPAAPTPAVVQSPGAPLPWLALLGVGSALVLAGAWLFWLRWLPPPLDRAQLQLERLGARAGLPWPTGATISEYAALLEARRGHSPALRELVAIVEAARYGRRPPTAEQTHRLAFIVAELRAWLRR